MDKVMKSNSKTYYTALVREGLPYMIQDFKSLDLLEKSLGINLVGGPEATVSSEETLEALISQTRN